MKPDTPEAYEEFVKGLWRENPVFVQVLGMCPSLAVTNTAVNSVAMAVATSFVLVASSVMVSALRRLIPNQVRISAYVLIIATFVTIADLTLQATFPGVAKELGAFTPLIVVNCIILGRAEAYANTHTVWLSFWDAVGMSGGFTLALMCLGCSREILGSGTLFGYSLFGPDFEPWVIMILPPGGFLMLGFFLLFFNWFRQSQRSAG